MDKNLFIDTLAVTPLQSNCYILHNDKEACVFDPGGDYHIIKQFLSDNNLSVSLILATHGHFDHIGAATPLKEEFNTCLYIHKLDLPLLPECAKHADMFGVPPCIPPEADYFLEDDEIINFCGEDIKAIHTPGHTMGSVSFYIESMALLISGDTLFFESVGRTDFETGNSRLLVKSIKEKLYLLDDKTKVLPGHGAFTTIGHEKKYNPYIRF